MSNPLVIYHGTCADGFTAAWACWILHPEWEYFAATHGHQPPDVTGREVYMLDFSYKYLVIKDMAMKATSITIIDHHKTAEGELNKLFADTAAAANVSVMFDIYKSGARLAWEHFHPDNHIPLLVLYVEDRDLWKFSLVKSREINANIFSYPYDFNVWSDLSEDINLNFGGFVAEGAAIERKHHKDVAELVAAFKHKMCIDGIDVWVANIPYTMTNDAGVLMSTGEPFAACYWITPTQVVFSLKSAEDGMDVSIIAAKYGGGGHAHSAGFQVSFDEFKRML